MHISGETNCDSKAKTIAEKARDMFAGASRQFDKSWKSARKDVTREAMLAGTRDQRDTLYVERWMELGCARPQTKEGRAIFQKHRSRNGGSLGLLRVRASLVLPAANHTRRQHYGAGGAANQDGEKDSPWSSTCLSGAKLAVSRPRPNYGDGDDGDGGDNNDGDEDEANETKSNTSILATWVLLVQGGTVYARVMIGSY